MDIDVLLECDQQDLSVANLQTDSTSLPTPHSHHMTTSTSKESDIEPLPGRNIT